MAVVTLGWQALLVAALILSREDSVFGWTEPTYTLARSRRWPSRSAPWSASVRCWVSMSSVAASTTRPPGRRDS